MEIWKRIKGFPAYEVSNMGNVRKGTLMLKLAKIYRGYRRVGLWKNQKMTGRSVHSLVLEAFVCPRPKGLITRHLDGNPSNNCVENLKWGTYYDNIADSRRHGTLCLGATHGRHKLTEKQVIEIIKTYKCYHFGRSNGPALARKYGLSGRRTIVDIVRGTTWKHLDPIRKSILTPKPAEEEK